jgi:hypothetical protein
MKRNGKSLTIFAAMLLLSAVIGCGGGGGTDSGGTGTLSLSLTDAATPDYEAVVVTIDRVEVHLGGNEANPNNWKTVVQDKRTYNLLDLVNGVQDFLGEEELEAGLYTQMRLIIGSEPDVPLVHPFANYIILAGTETIHSLFIPSGPETGIKLVKNFTIVEGQDTELILDFDAARSVVKAGVSDLWLLKPTIKVLDAETASIIEGAVVDQEGAPLAGVLVSAQVSNSFAVDPRDEVVVEAATLTDDTGEFRLLVQPGTYNIVVYRETYDYQVGCGIAVNPGETSSLDVIELTSLENEIEPAYGHAEVTVIVAGGGDVTISFRAPGCQGNIEVKSLSIDSGGSYEQILPLGAHEVVATSDGKATEVIPVIEVGIESPAVVDINI